MGRSYVCVISIFIAFGIGLHVCQSGLKQRTLLSPLSSPILLRFAFRLTAPAPEIK